MKPLKPVFIKWIDIVESKSGWMTLDELEEFIDSRKKNIVHQVGLLYEEDENQVVILNSYFPDETTDPTFGMCNVIPRGCILEMYPLARDPVYTPEAHHKAFAQE